VLLEWFVVNVNVSVPDVGATPYHALYEWTLLSVRFAGELKVTPKVSAMLRVVVACVSSVVRPHTKSPALTVMLTEQELPL
jgi:hypothetical protein